MAVYSSNAEDLLTAVRPEVFQHFLQPFLSNKTKLKFMMLSRFYYCAYSSKLMTRLDHIVNHHSELKFKNYSKYFITNYHETVVFGYGTQDNNSMNEVFEVKQNQIQKLTIKEDPNMPLHQKLLKPEPRENFGSYRVDEILYLYGGYQRFGKFMDGVQMNANMKEVDGFKDLWKFDLVKSTFTQIHSDLGIGKRRAPKVVGLKAASTFQLYIYGGSDGETKEYPRHISKFVFSDKRVNKLQYDEVVALPDSIPGRCNHIFYYVKKYNYILFGFGVNRGTTFSDLYIFEVGKKENYISQLLSNDNGLGDFAMGVTETYNNIVLFGGKSRNIYVEINKNLKVKSRPYMQELKYGNFYGELVYYDGEIYVMMNQYNDKVIKLNKQDLKNYNGDSDYEEDSESEEAHDQVVEEDDNA